MSKAVYIPNGTVVLSSGTHEKKVNDCLLKSPTSINTMDPNNLTYVLHGSLNAYKREYARKIIRTVVCMKGLYTISTLFLLLHLLEYDYDTVHVVYSYTRIKYSYTEHTHKNSLNLIQQSTEQYSILNMRCTSSYPRFRVWSTDHTQTSVIFNNTMDYCLSWGGRHSIIYFASHAKFNFKMF